MAHKLWCGKECCKCKGCNLDEKIPCSPNCENLNQDGTREIKKCIECKCDAIEDEER